MDDLKNSEQEDNQFKIDHTLPSSYTLLEDKIRDLTQSAYIFLIFAILISAFLIFNHITNFFIFYLFSEIMLYVIVLALVYLAITSFNQVKKLKPTAVEESKRTENILEFLEKLITDEFINEQELENNSSEIIYYHMADYAKEMIIKEFGELNPSYIDKIFEDYYTNKFDR